MYLLFPFFHANIVYYVFPPWTHSLSTLEKVVIETPVDQHLVKYAKLGPTLIKSCSKSLKSLFFSVPTLALNFREPFQRVYNPK